MKHAIPYPLNRAEGINHPNTVPLNHYTWRAFSLRWWVGVYLFLLIFEGALRKWVLPGLAGPLLIVRDPIALWLVWRLWQQNRFPLTFYIAGFVAVGVIGTITAVLLGHGNLSVALFGARIFLIHLPALFAIGIILNRDDVEKIGRTLLWVAPAMVVLVIFQFYSPQSAWVNRGVGGDIAGAGFGNVLGYSRPPATFSFANGNTLFFSLVGCFVFYFWLNSKTVYKPVLIAATIALLISIPLSISRSLLFQVIITAVFGITTILGSVKLTGRLVLGVLVFTLLLLFLNTTEAFQTSTEVFLSRFIEANETEGGVSGVFINRFLGGMYDALINSTDLPFFGFGLGMGSNVGSQLLTGERTFLIKEEEWGRIIGELGPLLGLFIIFLRVHLAMKFSVLAYNKMRQGDILSWMLLSTGLLLIAQGQWAQPTSLGFCTLIGGLIIASLSTNKVIKAQHPESPRFKTPLK